MTFTIDDVPIGEVTLPRMVQRILAFLDQLEDEKLVTTKRMAGVLGVSVGAVRDHSTHSALTAYRVRSKNVVYWANPQTITAYKEAIGDG